MSTTERTAAVQHRRHARHPVDLGLGGEWGGGALLAVEHAPKKKRGLYAAAPQMGSPVGFAAPTLTSC
jgi:MFS family permease